MRNVPAANRFIWDRGHFSMPMTLIRNARPVEQFRDVMARNRDKDVVVLTNAIPVSTAT